MNYEVNWQIDELEDGRKIQQATILYNPDKGETRAMRSKEDSADYRYFPDPDLPPLLIAPEWVERVRSEMPELPRAMAERFQQNHLLFEQDAIGLTATRGLAAYFEQTLDALERLPGVPYGSQSPEVANGKSVANWVLNTVNAYLNKSDLPIERSAVTPQQLAALLRRIFDQTISNNAARQVFDALWTGQGAEVDALIEAKGLKQMNDSGALEKIVDEVIAANAKSVEEYRSGKDKAFNALVGQVMKASKGKANPAQASELLKARLG